MTALTGPVILDLTGPYLTPEERDIIRHPMVAGIILFARNFESVEQIQQLCQDIRAARETPLLITVDQEGGRVQRFKAGFTTLPPLGVLGKLYSETPELAEKLSEALGWMMASEVLSVGVDLSFAPVLDLNKEKNTVIGSRAFHREPKTVTPLARAWINGMKAAGMAATGKHFPGHGDVAADSHEALPVDERDFSAILNEDLLPFCELMPELDGIMPAHILFPKIDSQPVGFSKIWLKDILQDQFKFMGVIFSDDLGMKGAESAGSFSKRANAALKAGCDFILVCNNRLGAEEILEQSDLKYVDPMKFKKLQGNFSGDMPQLLHSARWQACNSLLNSQLEKLNDH